MREDIALIRKEYIQADLDESSVLKSPFDQFEKWFQEALDSQMVEPTAMVLSTAHPNGQSFQRTVLLKTFSKAGFVFFTNYDSRKASHLNLNPNVSLLFPWYLLERQVAVTGQVKKVSTKESLAYFFSRPWGSQLGAWVSNQSEVITSRSILETQLAQMKQKFKDGKVPFPHHWGGYRVIPSSIEFWQGRANRLHDRIFFEKRGNHWGISRLSP